MTFIPDSISKDELLRIQVNAEADFVPAEETDTEDVDIDDAIEATFIDFLKKHTSPAESKAMALRILSQLGAWHSIIAIQAHKKGEDSCLAWAGDEKLIHMAFSCLEQVDLGEDQECTCGEN